MGEQRRFRAVVQQGERGRVFIEIPFVPSEVWGKKARHHVRGTIASVAFSGSLGSRNGMTFFPLAKELRSAASIAPGDSVDVVLESAEAQTAELPADLSSALARNKAALKHFEGLSTFYKNTWIKWIEGARRAETRTARLTKTIEMLAGGEKQP